MQSGVHVITPNKRLTSAVLNYYQAVQRAQFHLPDGSLRPHGQATRVFYEVRMSTYLPADAKRSPSIATGTTGFR